MKNLLSENMMRFGTKNLSEAAQKELVVKSIMETIEQHGLSNVIRKKLSEQNLKVPAGAKVNVDSPSKGQVAMLVPTDSKTQGMASKIIGGIMKATGGIDDNKTVQRLVYSINSPGLYYACLYIVAHSPVVKGNYGFNFSTVCNMLGQDMTHAAGAQGNYAPGSTIKMDAPGVMIAKATGYEGMYRDIERHLQQFNLKEELPTEVNNA
jgi:hypothetical protein